MIRYLFWLSFFIFGSIQAEPLKVAVASNFVPALQHIVREFEAQTGIKTNLVTGSTGQLFAQIKQGAPYDLFLAADVRRPKLLVEMGLADELFIYAQGQLVLTAKSNDCEHFSYDNNLKYMALANPDLAPYGLAAKQHLQTMHQWQPLKNRLVIGNNAAQALHMVVSGNASAGLVAQSLLVGSKVTAELCQWPVAAHTYEPIEQAMVNLKRSQLPTQVKTLERFIQSSTAQKLILEHGYLLGTSQ